MKITQPVKSTTHRRLLNRLAIGVLITQIAACAAPPLRVVEETPQFHDEGTLLVGEVIRDLTPVEIMDRYKKPDLEIAGWTESNIEDVQAVILSNFKQLQGKYDTAHVYYALVQKNSNDSLEYNEACLKPGPRLGSCTYGGDAVSFRVVQKPINLVGPSGLNIVEMVIEPRGQVQDCAYEDRGSNKKSNYRYALFCKSLFSKGWGWKGDEFVKRPVENSN